MIFLMWQKGVVALVNCFFIRTSWFRKPHDDPGLGHSKCFVLLIELEAWTASVIKKLNPPESRWLPVASAAGQTALSSREIST